MKRSLEEQKREKRGGFNMCKALDDLYHDAREEGMQQGIQQGIQRGMQQGILQGADRVNRLTLLLMEEKRYANLTRSASDHEYQNQLFEAYGL